jgi:ABC-type molybdate transport system substrate-binding protein
MYKTGVEVIGTLPGELKKLSEFAADICADSKGTEAAKALLNLLHSPEGVAAFLMRGFDPN